MDNEVKITLIATGFNVTGGKAIRKDEELRRLVEGADSEQELDIPTFLRRPIARRHVAETPAAEQKTMRFRMPAR
jgi:cell division protein FtsZ